MTAVLLSLPLSFASAHRGLCGGGNGGAARDDAGVVPALSVARRLFLLAASSSCRRLRHSRAHARGAGHTPLLGEAVSLDAPGRGARLLAGLLDLPSARPRLGRAGRPVV